MHSYRFFLFVSFLFSFWFIGTVTAQTVDHLQNDNNNYEEPFNNRTGFVNTTVGKMSKLQNSLDNQMAGLFTNETVNENDANSTATDNGDSSDSCVVIFGKFCSDRKTLALRVVLVLLTVPTVVLVIFVIVKFSIKNKRRNAYKLDNNTPTI